MPSLKLQDEPDPSFVDCLPVLGNLWVFLLAREGFDRRYGARPLQRTIESLVVTPLARYLIEHPGLHAAELGIDVTPRGDVVFQTVAP